MAIVFVSPTKKRSAAIWIASAVLVLVIILVAAITFLPELREKLAVAEPELVLTIPEVTINFGIMDSDRVKNLDPFLAVVSGLDDPNQPAIGRLDPFASYNRSTGTRR